MTALLTLDETADELRISQDSVQRWLGHSTIKMTERYAHLAPEHLREGATALAGIQRSYEDACH